MTIHITKPHAIFKVVVIVFFCLLNFVDNDDDIYETIEFSDSSNIYTEPIKSDYGALRKINIRTTPTPRIRMNKETNMKKSRATMNLEKYNLDIDNDIRSTDDETELRIKPLKVVHSNTKRNSTKVLCSMISVGLQFINNIKH